ncbi:tetratricopeptide repeat protein [Aureibacter tunicatorum]|uniref:Tetratricopeptide (TPR) repeat protein n=1 Tax=Aureibacter tunicatorum TaxID=866807 RepID=A0AAE3XMA9_9BACT|nr:tetratricopeptide repeat protein [Aureibacter tunicatorum]MDR6238545.1 tetratricopeptide (TPR) repeat protein [Aureibacter tunicatorum]BDD05524.1 hypothetical protein AUTU_30070 [Aureibacter tunicatorum]
MKFLYTTALLLIFYNSCQSQTQKIDNTLPMYGEIQKSEKHKEIDQQFIEECLQRFNSIDSSVNVHVDLAWKYFYNDDLKTAMKRFNQAWLLNPDFPDSYFGFAALMEMQNKPEAAEKFYKLGIEKDLDNNRSEICFQRIADCKEQLGDLKGTVSAYEKIVSINPNNSFAFKKIGYFEMQSNNSKKALSAYNQAIRLDPNDPLTYNNRAYLNQTLQNYQSAVDDYSKAIELNPKYIGALVNRGITLMQINQFQEAKQDFEACVSMAPNEGELRRYLGIVKLNLKEFSEACDQFKLAKKLGDEVSAQFLQDNCK